MQSQEDVWDRDVNFKCGLTDIVKICVRNVGDGVSDKVTCHRHLQITVEGDKIYRCFSTGIFYTPKIPDL